jgi:hypothetical protein
MVRTTRPRGGAEGDVVNRWMLERHVEVRGPSRQLRPAAASSLQQFPAVLGAVEVLISKRVVQVTGDDKRVLGVLVT